VSTPPRTYIFLFSSVSSFYTYLTHLTQRVAESFFFFALKIEGFGWLKHDILHFVRRLLVFLQFAGYCARAVFSAVNLAGTSFKCCRCFKVVSRVQIKQIMHQIGTFSSWDGWHYVHNRSVFQCFGGFYNQIAIGHFANNYKYQHTFVLLPLWKCPSDKLINHFKALLPIVHLWLVSSALVPTLLSISGCDKAVAYIVNS